MVSFNLYFQARSKHKMTRTGGAERVAHINSPPSFGPSVKAYFLVHVSLRSKRFLASSSRKLGREQKKKRNDGGGGGE